MTARVCPSIQENCCEPSVSCRNHSQAVAMGGEGRGGGGVTKALPAGDRLVRSDGANVGLFCSCAACGGMQTAVFSKG